MQRRHHVHILTNVTTQTREFLHIQISLYTTNKHLMNAVLMARCDNIENRNAFAITATAAAHCNCDSNGIVCITKKKSMIWCVWCVCVCIQCQWLKDAFSLASSIYLGHYLHMKSISKKKKNCMLFDWWQKHDGFRRLYCKQYTNVCKLAVNCVLVFIMTVNWRFMANWWMWIKIEIPNAKSFETNWCTASKQFPASMDGFVSKSWKSCD